MANSAFRLVDDDFDFEDLDEIDDIDLNGLANPEDGGATAGAPEASTGEAGYGGNVDYANNTGYVDAGEDCVTSAEGIFVAGDCRTKKVHQLTTAASDGSVAAAGAVEYINRME